MKQVTQASLGALMLALISIPAQADSIGVLIFDTPSTTNVISDSVSAESMMPLSFTATTLAPAAPVVSSTQPVYSAAPAVSGGIGDLIPETVGAAIYGGSEPVVYVPGADETRARTVAAVEVVAAATPFEGDRLDMSGRDGSLRACYAAGGIAKQSDDLSYHCTYDAASTGAGQASTESAYIAAPGVDTGYNGTTNLRDEALIDCMQRGGSLIQLASNEAFACAM